MPDPTTPFDDDVVADAAADAELDEATVREALRTHQQSVRSYPGVDDLVYEWRRAMAYDPLVERGDDAYHLVVLPHVWDEFGDQLDLGEAELVAVKAVHDRQARRAARARGDDESVYDDAAPVLLTRE